jgi:hypothetical protein
VSRYFQADDTGARHQGRNGYCTYIGNDLLAWFASTEHKSRINFLELLPTERRYEVNAEALAYLTERGLAACHRDVLAARPVVLTDPKAWATYLHRCGIDSPRAVTLATEGALLGGLVHWSQVKDSLKMSRPLNTGRLLLASGLMGALQNPQELSISGQVDDDIGRFAPVVGLGKKI